jgi:hypothetical protein
LDEKIEKKIFTSKVTKGHKSSVCLYPEGKAQGENHQK